VLEAHLYENKPAEEAAMQRLTPAERAQALALMDSTSDATHKRLAEDEVRHIAEMEDLSPHGHLQHLTVPVYLLHGQADNIIPSVETLWMAQELPGRSLQAMLVSPVLSHLDLESTRPGPLDEWRLVHFFALVLHATGTKDGRG
jgi:pimeloyl-ACP methyl ester carboxylesterase